jgi:hypothetical protein
LHLIYFDMQKGWLPRVSYYTPTYPQPRGANLFFLNP